MGIELERKFRLGRAPDWLGECPRSRIEQGYVAVPNDETEVRLRMRDDTAVLTVKRGRGERRTEREVELTEDQFEALWPLTEGRRITKDRYLVPHDRHEIEIDVYGGELRGFVTGEVEFDAEDDSASFDPPDWLGKEVTGEERFANEALAQRGSPEGRA